MEELNESPFCCHYYSKHVICYVFVFHFVRLKMKVNSLSVSKLEFCGGYRNIIYMLKAHLNT